MAYSQFPEKLWREKVFGQMESKWDAPDMKFSEFLKEAWPILEPANPLINCWLIDYLCEHLAMVTEGDIQKLLINIPPRNGKSNIVTILWPVWSWIRRPALRWVFCSYSAGLSTKHSVDRRRVIESNWFKERWGGIIRLSLDQNQKQEYENTRRGHMIATSVGGTITGKGGDVIVEDDMLNPMEAESEAARRHSLDMHKNVLSTRLDNPKTGARVVVEQRTHYKDVSGHIIAEEKGWTHIILPLVSERKTIITFPQSGAEVIREPGDLLNPERQGGKEVDELKSSMGTRSFVAQAQQNPTSEQGNILKRHWWKYWNVVPTGWDIAIQSWDMTFKETQAGSYVVGQCWIKVKARFYLIDQFRKRVDFPEAILAVKTFTGKHGFANAKLIEDKANGPAIISTLTHEIPGIIPVQPLGTKLARAQSVAPFAEAGNIYLPHPTTCPWVHDFIEECAAFKGAPGETNDQVDTFSQAISWLKQLDYSAANVDDGLGDSFLDESELQMAGGFSNV